MTVLAANQTPDSCASIQNANSALAYWCQNQTTSVGGLIGLCRNGIEIPVVSTP
ncbi:hypothetical protein PP101_36 [Pectobacterium phage PP101]|uniref:Uncharacterized protein n=1 Tax=Pectobacterium phage PP101 TaxID=1916414 RepID=A0A1J0MEZ9_9CAUD|nr:hypothetical protein HOR42_gp36 [Pectobacterium phage PP101]APD19696.1 hypothetical protein PP101_36 [Pectobacterium phage PP101]